MKTFSKVAVIRAISIALVWLIPLAYLLTIFTRFNLFFQKLEEKESLPFATTCYLNLYRWISGSYGLVFILYIAVLITIDYFFYRFSERTRKCQMLNWLIFSGFLLASIVFFSTLQYSLFSPVVFVNKGYQ